jgi:hypothetical protein
MKTTAIFIEQVIIGFIVLAISLLPVHSAITPPSKDPLGTKDVFVAAAAVGVAYLLGIIFDRYADACAQRYERHLRARYAIELAAALTEPAADPFPEDRYRIQQLRAEKGVTEWFNYLRSTIRLSRGLTVFVPGLTLAAVMAIRSSAKFDVTAIWGYYILIAIYLGLPVISMSLGNSIWGDFVARTDQPDRLKRYALDRGLGSNAGRPLFASKLTQLMDFLWSPCVVGGTLLFAAATVQAITSPDRNLALVAVGSGFAFTLLSAWAWATMQNTFMRYLHLSSKYGVAGPATTSVAK